MLHRFKSRVARGDFTSSFLDGGLAALFLELAMAELKERVWGTYNKNIWTSAFFFCVCVRVYKSGFGEIAKRHSIHDLFKVIEFG